MKNQKLNLDDFQENQLTRKQVKSVFGGDGAGDPPPGQPISTVGHGSGKNREAPLIP